MAEPQWEDPPTFRTGPISGTGHSLNPELVAFVEALRQNPKRWARYPRTISSGACSVAAARIKRGEGSFIGGGFEATSRKVDGTRVLYVRYVGDLS